MKQTINRKQAVALSEIMVWGAQRGWQLLGGPVDIIMTDTGLGFTHAAVYGEAVQIYVNPMVLEKPNGKQLLQGLILHELGHHLAHFSDPAFASTNLLCRSKNLKNLLNLIEDEHLERRLRAMNPTWGESLDALGSYAFKGRPLRLLMEQFTQLLNFPSVGEAAAAVLAEKVPGKVILFEFGYKLTGGPVEWVSYRMFVLLVKDRLIAGSPDGKLSEDILAKMQGFHDRAEASWIRKSSRGILPDLLDDNLFSVTKTAAIVRAKIHITKLLERDNSSDKDVKKYLASVKKKTKPYLKHFPKLQRYLDELDSAKKSKWFWNKQSAMLFMMRRNRDFSNAFLPALEMDEADFEKLLGDSFNPALILKQLCDQWNPVPEENPLLPLEIEISWIEALRMKDVSDFFRFMVALRLGLGKKGASGSEPVLKALKCINKGLRKLDMIGLWDVTQKVAACLGSCSFDLRQPADGNSQDASTGESGESGENTGSDGSKATPWQEAVMSQQQGDLGDVLSGEDRKKLSSEIKEAGKIATRSIDEWIRSGMPLNPLEIEGKKPATRGHKPSGVEVVYDIPKVGRGGSMGKMESDLLNLSKSLHFPALTSVSIPAPNPKLYRKMVSPLRGHIRSLRQFLLELGEADQEIHGQRTGTRLDPARIRRLAIMNEPNVMIGREVSPAPNIFLGVCVDCSGSMVAEDRMDKALSFAALLMESAKGLDGVECKVLGFTDCVLFDVGKPGSTRLASLEPGDGNNDAGALLEMARRALHSNKEHRLLVMISDGFPTACSVGSLAALVKTLESRYQIKSVQVAVAGLDPLQVAFPDFTDLSEDNINISIKLFGRMIRKKILRW